MNFFDLTGTTSLTARWLLLASILLISSPAFSLEQVTLQLKWRHQFQFAGYYAAIKEGYYKEEGLDVSLREVIPGRSSADVVLSGDADYGIAETSLITQRLRGAPVIVVAAIFQQSPIVLLSLSSSGIEGPVDLHDKRVMYRATEDDAVINAMFLEQNLSNEDFIHVPHNFRDDILLHGVDAMSAYITDQPYLYLSQNIPINIIDPSNYGVDFYGDMIFTSEEHISDHPEQVEAFRRASLKGWEYAVNNPEATIDWMLKHLNVEKSRQHLLYEAERTIRLIRPDYIELGYFNPKRFARIASLYKEMGLANPDADIDDFYYEDFLNQPLISKKIKNALLIAIIPGVAFYIFLIWHVQRLKAVVKDRTEDLQKRQLINDKHVKSLKIDNSSAIVDASSAFCTHTGFNLKNLVGMPIGELFTDAEGTGISTAMLGEALSDGQWSGELQLESRQGRHFDFLVNAEKNSSKNQRQSELILFLEDVTHRKKLLKISTLDPLTGLNNRRKLEENLLMLVKQASRYSRHFSLVVMDVDHFKSINDSFGHDFGDEVLLAIAKLLKEQVREADMVGRWGGEEFMILCPETELGGAVRLSENIRQCLEALQLSSGLTITASFGVAQWKKGDTHKDIFKRADEALYVAKSQGRNQVVDKN